MMIVVPAFAKMLEGAKDTTLPKLSEAVFSIGIPMSKHPLSVTLGIVTCGLLLGVIFERMRIRRVRPATTIYIMVFSFLTFALLEMIIVIAIFRPLIVTIRKIPDGITYPSGTEDPATVDWFMHSLVSPIQ